MPAPANAQGCSPLDVGRAIDVVERFVSTGDPGGRFAPWALVMTTVSRSSYASDDCGSRGAGSAAMTRPASPRPTNAFAHPGLADQGALAGFCTPSNI